MGEILKLEQAAKGLQEGRGPGWWSISTELANAIPLWHRLAGLVPRYSRSEWA